jgi:hypothetical protein
MTAPRKIFRTGGVRGIANLEPATAETARKLVRLVGISDQTPRLKASGYRVESLPFMNARCIAPNPADRQKAISSKSRL